jgi:hypothetical protein
MSREHLYFSNMREQTFYLQDLQSGLIKFLEFKTQILHRLENQKEFTLVPLEWSLFL